MPWPSDSVLTLQPHPYGKAAFEKVGVRVMSIWWRRHYILIVSKA